MNIVDYYFPYKYVVAISKSSWNGEDEVGIGALA